MRLRPPACIGILGCLCLSIVPATADDVIEIILRGKVVMGDGSVPDKSVMIERICDDMNGSAPGPTVNKKGEYIWRVKQDTMAVRSCRIRASSKGYVSTVIDISNLNLYSDTDMRPLVLSRSGGGSAHDIVVDNRAPSAANGPWNRALTAMALQNWSEAENQLRLAVQAAPKFAEGWSTLGAVCENEQKLDDARAAYQHAIDSEANQLHAYLRLARLSLDLKDWEAAIKAADGLLKIDGRHYPEAYLHKAVAQYELKDMDGAEVTATYALRLDERHQLPRAEYMLGLILEAKHDNVSAAQHMSAYLELAPKAEDAAKVRAEIENLGKGDIIQTASVAELLPTGPGVGSAVEAWVPGGMKALAAVAHFDGPYSTQDFFGRYCRAIARENFSTGTSLGIPQYLATLRVYMATVSELGPLAVVKGDRSVITLSAASDEQRKQTERILPLLGWKLAQTTGSFTVEPGDLPADGLRQGIPGLFGIDEIAMMQALEAGRDFQFEIPTENAALVGADAWNALLKDLPLPPGGFAAAFTTDLKMANACAGLSAMGPEPARVLLSTIGLRTLVARHAELLGRFGEAFSISNGAVLTPGGSDAQAAWAKLVGANPSNPAAFFRALLEKQTGKVAAFYFAVWRSDAEHQKFLTKTPERMERYYAWYTNSEEFRYGVTRQTDGWRSELLQKLPLDPNGNVRFPGGRGAWNSVSDDGLLGLDSLEALVPVAQIERKRKQPLDEGSAKLLAMHFTEWRSLFPYFERLPALGQEEFSALAKFEGAVGSFSPAAQNTLLAEWHSLVELVARGTDAGSLDGAQGARAFRRICNIAVQDHPTQAVDALREMMGGAADLNEAVPGALLRLTGSRRAAFDRVMELQGVPRLSTVPGAQDPSKVAAALSGFVYAASLDPEALLVNEDSGLLAKHRFAVKPVPTQPLPRGARPAVFFSTELVGSSNAPGSFVAGGFANFAEVAQGFVHGGKAAPRTSPALRTAAARNTPPPAVPAAGPPDSLPESASVETVFHVGARLVEVWATVTDSRGRYIDDLPVDQFTVLEQKAPQNIVAFESQLASVSVALLLDTTGSMQAALPALKSAALKLIGELRLGDSVAVYSFNKAVTEMQPFTTDKDAAKRAVLRTSAFGDTALYDALTRVGRDFSGRTGKKVIVVFTDGNDNSSTLTSDTAVLRAKAAGVPVYTIAQGEALIHPEFLKQLADLSKATGGVAFVIHEPGEIATVFEKVSEDLTHGYLLTFQPSPGEEHVWRNIDVLLKGNKGHKVRAKEGFYPE